MRTIRWNLFILGFACLVAFSIMGGPIAWGAEPTKEIVLIGGPKSHGVGEHDFPNGIAVLKQLLDASPDARDMRTVAFHNGWPTEPSALEGASSLVFYFDGLEIHPLLDKARRAEFEALMRRGVGVVALHQASSVPANDTSMDLSRWLGGARYGMFDRTTETLELQPHSHPIGNGVGKFQLTDEFYPTIRFSEDRKKLTPILIGHLHPQFRNGRSQVIGAAETHPVAWTFERDDGGRAFTFTGLHYLVGLDQPAVRKLVLNAIFWTAKASVPENGVTTDAPRDAAQRLIDQESRAGRKSAAEAIITRRSNDQVIEYPWGRLTWYASRELENSETMTVGQAIIKPGMQNPRHLHPNCDEILHVVKGRIIQTMGDRSVEMGEGDTVSIPAGVHHNAKNIGSEDAVLSLSYSSADRQVIGE